MLLPLVNKDNSLKTGALKVCHRWQSVQYLTSNQQVLPPPSPPCPSILPSYLSPYLSIALPLFSLHASCTGGRDMLTAVGRRKGVTGRARGEERLGITHLLLHSDLFPLQNAKHIHICVSLFLVLQLLPIFLVNITLSEYY